jgi:hypothetical protein
LQIRNTALFSLFCRSATPLFSLPRRSATPLLFSVPVIGCDECTSVSGVRRGSARPLQRGDTGASAGLATRASSVKPKVYKTANYCHSDGYKV